MVNNPEWVGGDSCSIFNIKKRGGDMASKRAKRLDQLYVSRAEFKKYDSKKKKMVKDRAAESVLKFERSYFCWFGAPAFRRLKRSAKRAKRSTLGYFLDVLTK